MAVIVVSLSSLYGKLYTQNTNKYTDNDNTAASMLMILYANHFVNITLHYRFLSKNHKDHKEKN